MTGTTKQCITLLRNCAESLPKAGRVLVVEMGDLGGRPSEPRALDGREHAGAAPR